jgi:hypothetical protein
MLAGTMVTDYGRLPVDEQVAAFQAVLPRNQTLAQVLARAAVLGLPGWYLVAGCLYQTGWNVVTGQPPEAGILDYDLAYFDASDLSWRAEDAAIQAGRRLSGDLPAPVQIRNQAQHPWHEQKFGVPAHPMTALRAAIDTFEATTAPQACAAARGRGRCMPRTGWEMRSTSSCGLPGTGARPRLPKQDCPVALRMAVPNCPAPGPPRPAAHSLANQGPGPRPLARARLQATPAE